MRRIYIAFVLSLFILLSCTSGDPLEGIWKVQSDFYKATCQINKERTGYQGLVLSYDDGTTIFTHDSSNPKHLFKELKLKDNEYVDGVSSATMKPSARKSIAIKMLNKDSIKITTYIMNRPVEELWTKINENE